MTESPALARVTELVAPIVADLHLDLYDLEFRGGTLRITVDTPANTDGGVSLDTIALATRLISRDLDHHDPVPGHYVLEVTSPGLERALRTPAHFGREVGKDVALRLRDIGEGGERRVHGRLVTADDSGVTVVADDGLERTVAYDHIDRAKTVFEWGPTPKKGAPKKGTPKKGTPGAAGARNPSKGADAGSNARNVARPGPVNEGAGEVSAANGAQSRAYDEGAGEVSAANGAQSRPIKRGAAS